MIFLKGKVFLNVLHYTNEKKYFPEKFPSADKKKKEIIRS